MCGELRMASGEWGKANSGYPTRYSLLVTRYSLLATRYSLFAIRYSPFANLRRRPARGLNALLRRDQAVDGGARRRLGEQEALHLVAAGEPQQDALLLGLDPLAQDGEA